MKDTIYTLYKLLEIKIMVIAIGFEHLPYVRSCTKYMTYNQYLLNLACHHGRQKPLRCYRGWTWDRIFIIKWQPWIWIQGFLLLNKVHTVSCYILNICVFMFIHAYICISALVTKFQNMPVTNVSLFLNSTLSFTLTTVRPNLI